MNIQEIKEKMSKLPLVSEIPADEELEKFINLSILIFDVYFDLETDFKNTEQYEEALIVEICHLIENTPYEDVFKQYNYLSSFNVAGAISGTVKEKYISYLSPLVKAYMKKLRVFN